MTTQLSRFVPRVRRNNSKVSAKAAATPTLAPADRREHGSAVLPKRLSFDRFVLDIAGGVCLAHDMELRLRPKSFEVLKYLANNPGRVVSKEELLMAVWPNVCVTDDSVVQCITELRSALDDQEQRIIKTLSRRGYRFELLPTSNPPGRPYDSRHVTKPAIVFAVFVVLLMVGIFSAISFWGINKDTKQVAAPAFSIVVLPFTSLSQDSTQAHLGEGIAVDVITELSRLPGLFVIAPATARTVVNKAGDPREIGRVLNVRYVLEGSVREFGDRLRITTQLVNALSGQTLWSERFDSGGIQYPAWQDELIGRIANSLNYKLTKLESERHQGDLPSSKAFDLSVRGWALVYAAKSPKTYGDAIDLFRQALKNDPGSTRALTGLGWTLAVRALVGWSKNPRAEIAEANMAVTKVLAADSNNVVAQHIRGFLLRLQQRPAEAHDAFKIAASLSPSFAPSQAQLGATALEIGRPSEAIEAVNQAMRLSPRDPSRGAWYALMGRAYLQLDQIDEAVLWLRRAIETGTPIVLTHAYLASALALSGKIREAEEALGHFLSRRPRTTLGHFMEQDRKKGTKFVTQNLKVYKGLRVAGLRE